MCDEEKHVTNTNAITCLNIFNCKGKRTGPVESHGIQ